MASSSIAASYIYPDDESERLESTNSGGLRERRIILIT
jgi:hypothetical protein